MNPTNNKRPNLYINFLNIEDSSWIQYLQCNYEPAINIEFKYSNPYSIFIDFMIEKSFYEFKKIIIPMSKNHKRIFNVNHFYTCLNYYLRESLTALITPTLTMEYKAMQDFKTSWADTTIVESESFVSLLSSKKYKLQLFKSNPELLRKLAANANHCIHTYIKIYSRITTDYKELINTFGKLGKLVHLSCADKDIYSHLGTAKVCKFENNTIIYISCPLQPDETTDLSIDQAHSNHIKKATYEYRKFQ